MISISVWKWWATLSLKWGFHWKWLFGIGWVWKWFNSENLGSENLESLRLKWRFGIDWTENDLNSLNWKWRLKWIKLGIVDLELKIGLDWEGFQCLNLRMAIWHYLDFNQGFNWFNCICLDSKGFQRLKMENEQLELLRLKWIKLEMGIWSSWIGHFQFPFWIESENSNDLNWKSRLKWITSVEHDFVFWN